MCVRNGLLEYWSGLDNYSSKRPYRIYAFGQFPNILPSARFPTNPHWTHNDVWLKTEDETTDEKDVFIRSEFLTPYVGRTWIITGKRSLLYEYLKGKSMLSVDQLVTVKDGSYTMTLRDGKLSHEWGLHFFGKTYKILAFGEFPSEPRDLASKNYKRNDVMIVENGNENGPVSFVRQEFLEPAEAETVINIFIRPVIPAKYITLRTVIVSNENEHAGFKVDNEVQINDYSWTRANVELTY